MMTRKEMRHYADELVGKLLHGHGKKDDAALDWKDIRLIVRTADGMHHRRSHDELVAMGEEAYYSEVLRIFKDHRNG